MQLPSKALISTQKLTQYLLTLRRRNDKSRWLAQAGYTIDNWPVLENDLRQQILPLEATPTENSRYGQTYEIRGSLTGPNGSILAICTVWMTEKATVSQSLLHFSPIKGRKNEISII